MSARLFVLAAAVIIVGKNVVDTRSVSSWLLPQAAPVAPLPPLPPQPPATLSDARRAAIDAEVDAYVQRLTAMRALSAPARPVAADGASSGGTPASSGLLARAPPAAPTPPPRTTLVTPLAIAMPAVPAETLATRPPLALHVPVRRAIGIEGLRSLPAGASFGTNIGHPALAIPATPTASLLFSAQVGG
jgi:hypothetical protein